MNSETMQTIEMVTEQIVVEGKMEGARLLEVMTEEGVRPALVARAIRAMVDQGSVELQGDGSITNSEVIFIKEFEAPKTITVEPVEETNPAPKDKRYPFGFDIQQDYRTGRSYKRARTSFDGPKFELPPEYQALKALYKKFSLELIQAIPEFNGAGQYAIAILNEDTDLEQFEDKNGNVYYRWNSEKVMEIMDKYLPDLEAIMATEDKD